MENKRIYHVTQIALLVAIMAVLSYIRIPLPTGVPIVLENLGVMLAALLLGAKRGSIAVVLFIILRLIGIGGAGGLILLAGPSAGYVYGWLFMPIIIDEIVKHFHITGWVGIFVIILIAAIVVDDFIFGTAGLMMFVHMSLTGAITANLSFIIGDMVKALVAAVLYVKLMKSAYFRNLIK